MQFVEDYAEVIFNLNIPNFSTYTDFDQTFTEEFPLKVNNFSSRWSLTLSPFGTENANEGEKDPFNRDIGIVLKCNSCNVNMPDIEVYSKVQGNEPHEKTLPQVSKKDMTWKGILIARAGLKVFRLLKNDQLMAKIRFVVKGCDMTTAVGGVESLSKDMRALLKRGSYSDADIITSDGIKLPVHLAVLCQRSDLLQRISAGKKRQLTFTATPDKKMIKWENESSEDETKCDKDYLIHAKPETPINSTFGSISSGYQSCSSRASSPEHFLQQSTSKDKIYSSPVAGTPKFTSPAFENRHLAHRKNTETPRKPTPHRISQMSTVTSPKKGPFSPISNIQMKSSPSSPRRTLHSQTPKRISNIYSPTVGKSSPTKKTRTPDQLSMSKRTLPRRRSSIGMLRTLSPSKRLKPPISPTIHKISASKMQQLRRTPLIGTPSPRRRLYHDSKPGDSVEDFTIPCQSPSTKACGPTKTNDFSELDFQSQRPKIFVNMSASVTSAILDWIYTGECNEVDKLSRALLVGSIRHGVTGLARTCEYHLAADLTPINAPEIIFLAKKYSAPVLQELAIDFAVKKAAEVTSQPMWSKLAVRIPGLIAEYSRRLAIHAESISKT
ncbi:uncharacterized protein [Palaemon carinicauda]|uniref:uncharacterized protein n=1 Tax=Palaemon carinicauda TaxID=392227 RepID=UPI0035B65CB9